MLSKKSDRVHCALLCTAHVQVRVRVWTVYCTSMNIEQYIVRVWTVYFTSMNRILYCTSMNSILYESEQYIVRVWTVYCTSMNSILYCTSMNSILYRRSWLTLLHHSWQCRSSTHSSCPGGQVHREKYCIDFVLWYFSWCPLLAFFHPVVRMLEKRFFLAKVLKEIILQEQIF